MPTDDRVRALCVFCPKEAVSDAEIPHIVSFVTKTGINVKFVNPSDARAVFGVCEGCGTDLLAAAAVGEAENIRKAAS